MYRVRISWTNTESQVGAYNDLNNAKKRADEFGYKVFDEEGKCVYSAPVPFRTMAYKATLKRAVGPYKKGKEIVVTRNKKKEWIMESNGTKIPAKDYMDLTKQYYITGFKFTAEQAAEFMKGYDSPTGWLIWCNKHTQTLYVLKGKKGAWVCQKRYKCGTGNIANGDNADQGVGFSWKIYDKQEKYKTPSGGIQYWNMHYSSPGGNSIHRGPVGKPSTHGCIALADKAVQWVFKNVPIGTKVVVY